MKTKKKRVSYREFCKAFNITSLDVPLIKSIATQNNIKITNLHNVIDDAKCDGRL